MKETTSVNRSNRIEYGYEIVDVRSDFIAIAIGSQEMRVSGLVIPRILGGFSVQRAFDRALVPEGVLLPTNEEHEKVMKNVRPRREPVDETMQFKEAYASLDVMQPELEKYLQSVHDGTPILRMESRTDDNLSADEKSFFDAVIRRIGRHVETSKSAAETTDEYWGLYL